jgi:hypothetical protein
MKWMMSICLLALCSCAREPAFQDFPPCPERQRPTPDELKRSENNPDILAKIGDLHAGPDWHGDAGLMVYLKALEIDPNHVRANLGAAIVYTRTNNPKKALPHWEKVVEFAQRGSPERLYAEATMRLLKEKEPNTPSDRTR